MKGKCDEVTGKREIGAGGPWCRNAAGRRQMMPLS
jgi:hypothetical protein